MKTLYEVTRPIIERISVDGEVNIAVQYAYELYRDEIKNLFDKGVVLDAWRSHLLQANVEDPARNNLLRRMVLGQGQLESVHPSFYDRLAQSSLAYQVNSQQSVDYGELLFNELIVYKLLDDTHNVVARNYCTWLAWAIELVLHLEDTTQTFNSSDVDNFTYWVTEVLMFLPIQRENIPND